MSPQNLPLLLAFGLRAAALTGCRFDIYAPGPHPTTQETCFSPNTPIASYELALDTCTFVENLPSDYRYKVTALEDIKAAIWYSSECFVIDRSDINTLELDYCHFTAGITSLHALCWRETFDPSTTATLTFDNTAPPVSGSAGRQPESQSQTPAQTTESLSMGSKPIGTSSANDGDVSEGLQKEGNRIALGVGLGIGVPALVVAVLALVQTTRKRRAGPRL